MYNNKSMTRYVWGVRVLAALLGMLQLAYALLAWYAPVPIRLGTVAMSFYPRGMDAGAVAGLAPALHWSGAACSLPALLMLGYALVRLDRMLAACSRGRLFALDTVGHMKAFTGGILAALVWAIVEPAVRAGVWRFALDAPRQAFDVGVSSEELTLVLVCALFFVVASMMHEARRIAEDNEGFV